MAKKPVGPEARGWRSLGDPVGYRYSDEYPVIIDDRRLKEIAATVEFGALVGALGIAKEHLGTVADVDAIRRSLTNGIPDYSDIEGKMAAGYRLHPMADVRTCDQLANMLAANAYLFVPSRELGLIAPESVKIVMAADILARLMVGLADRNKINPLPAVAALLDEHVRRAGLDVNEVSGFNPLAFVAASMAFKSSIHRLVKDGADAEKKNEATVFSGGSLKYLLERSSNCGNKALQAAPTAFFMGVAMGIPDDLVGAIFTAIANGDELELVYS